MPSGMSRLKNSAIDIDNFDNADIYDPLSGSSSITKGNKKKSTGSNLDRRRQVHLICEHRRRKEIQDALEALDAELPHLPKPRSKSGIIVDSAEMIKDLTFTLDKLLNDNQTLLNRLQMNDLTK